MPVTTCCCQCDECGLAAAAIRRAERIAQLVDDSHFIVSIAQCRVPGCGQRHITMFCECVDWADSDDPQSWVAAPISEAEAAQLQSTDVAADENRILAILSTPRRFLFRNMPKSAPETIEWKHGPVFIPGHD